MEFQTITYKRATRFKIDARRGRGLVAARQQGMSLRDIQKGFKAENIDVSIPTISRAIARAEKAA